MKTTSKKLNEQMERFYKLNEQMKSAKKEMDLLKEELKSTMTKKGEKILHGSSFTAMVTDVNRTGLDKEGLKDFLGDKIQEFETVTRYMTFKVVKG